MFDKVKMSSLNESTVLKDLLIKTTHQKVISLFLAHPTRHFYGTEISKIVGISIGQTSKVLNDLFKAGILERERKGKTELYNISPDSAVLRTYKVLNTLISITPLIEKLKKVSKRVILYGSCAKGTNIEESDLDMLIVSSSGESVLKVIGQFSSKNYYGFSEIRPVIKKPSEWASLEEKDPVFYSELQKGVLLFEKEIDESRL